MGRHKPGQRQRSGDARSNAVNDKQRSLSQHHGEHIAPLSAQSSSASIGFNRKGTFRARLDGIVPVASKSRTTQTSSDDAPNPHSALGRINPRAMMVGGVTAEYHQFGRL